MDTPASFSRRAASFMPGYGAVLSSLWTPYQSMNSPKAWSRVA